MAISKITLNGVTQMDVTQKTVTASTMLSPATALKNDGTDITGSIATKTSANMTASGATVTAPAGYYESDASKSVASGSATAPVSITGTSATVSTGTNTLTLSKTISVTPTVSAGYVSSGTAGDSSVSLTANINTRSSSDLSVSEDTVTAPAGYYSSSASKAVASGTAGTPTASKGTVSNHAISVTPSVTNVTGYITGGTKTGTAVSVSASELVSGTKSITSSGTTDVTNYASASVEAGSLTAGATKGTVSSHQISVTPYVDSTSGFVGTGRTSGTAVTVSASELVSGSETKTSNGTYDVTNLAQIIVNTPVGLEYEEGTYVPTANITNPTISFTNAHSKIPSYIILCDIGTDVTVGTGIMNWAFVNWQATFGVDIQVIAGTYSYARIYAMYKTTSSYATSTTNFNSQSDSGVFSDYVTTSSFTPFVDSSRKYINGRTYKWIAMWTA